MSFTQRAIDELEEIGLITLFFASWFVMLMWLKRLVLAQYDIAFAGLSVALISALIVAKVVAVLEKVPLSRWIAPLPAAIDVTTRTLLYTLGVAVAMFAEKAFEIRHEAGGFGAALLGVFHHRDVHHVWAAVIGVGGALLVFNVLSVVRHKLGEGELSRLLFRAPLEKGDLAAPAHR